jgi:hypothetical protein
VLGKRILRLFHRDKRHMQHFLTFQKCNKSQKIKNKRQNNLADVLL